jgi:hypothetical protein
MPASGVTVHASTSQLQQLGRALRDQLRPAHLAAHELQAAVVGMRHDLLIARACPVGLGTNPARSPWEDSRSSPAASARQRRIWPTVLGCSSLPDPDVCSAGGRVRFRETDRAIRMADMGAKRTL